MLLVLLALNVAWSDEVPAGPTTFTCCDNPGLQRIVHRYTTWMASIAQGEGNASGHAYALVPMLAPLPGLSPADNAVIGQVRARVERARNLKGDALLRVVDEIGPDLVYLALRHEGGSLTLAEAWCEGRGPWLQRDLTAPLPLYPGGCERWR